MTMATARITTNRSSACSCRVKPCSCGGLIDDSRWRSPGRTRRETVHYPAAPFQRHLDRLVEEELRRVTPNASPIMISQAERRVGGRMERAQRTIHGWRVNATSLTRDEISKALLADGDRVTLDDLYPDGPATVVGDGDRPAVLAPERVCAWRGCHEPCGDTVLTFYNSHGKVSSRFASRFCAEHGAVLARVRSELEGDSAVLTANGGGRRADTKTAPRNLKKPTCCTPTCYNDRRPPDRFCGDCIADGASEDDYV